MTLTVPTVNAARHRLVLATGAAKAAIVERWLLHDHALPIDRVSRTDTAGRARRRGGGTIAARRLGG